MCEPLFTRVIINSWVLPARLFDLHDEIWFVLQLYKSNDCNGNFVSCTAKTAFILTFVIQGDKIEGVVLNRVYILFCFLSYAAAHLYLNISRACPRMAS